MLVHMYREYIALTYRTFARDESLVRVWKHHVITLQRSVTCLAYCTYDIYVHPHMYTCIYTICTQYFVTTCNDSCMHECLHTCELSQVIHMHTHIHTCRHCFSSESIHTYTYNIHMLFSYMHTHTRIHIHVSLLDPDEVEIIHSQYAYTHMRGRIQVEPILIH